MISIAALAPAPLPLLCYSRRLARGLLLCLLFMLPALTAHVARLGAFWFPSILKVQVHQSRRIAANECQDMERLAQYIVRNLFSIAKMQVNRSGDSILYRSGMNPKIKRNFFIYGSIHAGIQRV